MANIYILIEEDYINVYCNDFNRCSYFSFFSIYCFAKNQKNETRRYIRGKEKLNVFLICIMPVPVIAIVLILLGLKAFI